MASAQPDYTRSNLHDDESLLEDDLIDADDGEYGDPPLCSLLILYVLSLSYRG